MTWSVATPGPVERARDRLRRVSGLATAVMLLMSRPLWVGIADFPTVPFVPALPVTNGVVSRVLFLALVAAAVGSALGRVWRPYFGAGVVLFAFLIGQDQHRFQPWAYQYGMTLLLLAAMPGGEGLRYVRWWFVSLYAYSGLSKLDASFCQELGPVFLHAALAPLGVDPARWPEAWRVAAVLAMPAGEVAVAAGLAAPGWRRLGRAGALALHATLIGVLGPTGLGHSPIVLVWNAAMLAEVWLAFGPDLASETGPVRPVRAAYPVKAIFWAGVLLPMGERWGAFDAWPSHALYASHVEKVSVLLHESSLGGYPGSVLRHVGGAGEGPWRRLDLTGWSREVRGTPVYPQNRACLGLAEALGSRYGGPLSVRVVVFGPADCWTGRRRHRGEATGPVAVRGLGDRYRLNARPGADGRREPGEHRRALR